MVHLCCMKFLTFWCIFYVFVCDLCTYVPQCMNYVLDNLWCRNSKNLCVPMILHILYDVFDPFSSMLPIVHVQSIYNVNKLETTKFMISVDFLDFFCTRNLKID
jgi:hypothetical protein